MIDVALIFKSIPALMSGACLSMQIALIAAVLGLMIGIILAFAENLKSSILRFAIWAYITLFRGTPMLIQILFVYYVLPQFGLKISPVWAASIAIGLNSGAYISQIFRTGINAVSKGQVEAAYTLGMNSLMTMRYIIFPQAWRTALPSLGNEFITLIKDSSLASIIGVMELSKEASIIRSNTYDPFSILLAVALIYLILTVTVSFCVKNLERRLKTHA
jgi:His/Glu/Gln/Arg/opine family amino acid ABC transporter permease subunit